MISWTEKEPDFAVQPLDTLFSRLSFSKAATLWSRVGDNLLIIVDTQARQRIEEHLETLRIEQGGLLIGRVFGDAEIGPAVVTIEDSVSANDARGTGVSLTMGSSVWSDARELCRDDRYVVGWYHSHPNLGAFFSGTDRYTQRAFFGNAHSVGLVSDPIRREEKWFAGPESIEVPFSARYIWSLTTPA